MTRRVRLAVTVASAVLLVAAFGIAQATDYARAPLLPTPATDHQADLDAVARSTRCGDLRARYGVEHSVWKGGVKDHHRAEVEPNHQMMVAILERLAWLEDRGRCGG